MPLAGKQLGVCVHLLMFALVTFIMHPEVVLRQADIAEFVFGAPGSGERGLLLIDGRVKESKPLVELFFLLAESQVSVNNNRHQKPTAR